MEIPPPTAGGHESWICSGRVCQIFYAGGSCTPAPCTSTSSSRGCSRHPPPTPSLGFPPVPWERSFPSAPGSLPAQREFWILRETQETGIWSFLLHSRNKNVASTKPKGARFLWRGLLRLSGSTRANANLFHSWSVSPVVALLVCVGGAGHGPSPGGHRECDRPGGLKAPAARYRAATCPSPGLRAGPQRLSARSVIPLPAAESSLCCFKHLFPISKIRLVRKISLGCLNFYQGLQKRGGEGGEAVGFPNQDRLLQSETLFKGKRERTEGEKHPF